MQILRTASDNGIMTAALSLEGRFDAHEADGFRQQLDSIIDEGVNIITVDMRWVEFVDSTALAELVRGMKRCREVGGDLRLSRVSDSVRVILELTKLDSAFNLSSR